jgi:hypothetical protein
MNGPLEWIAAIGTMIAAGLIASNRGRKVTGGGFVLFVAVATTWIIAALMARPPSYPLAAMNGILVCINAWGVWQYLFNPRKKREIELVEECTVQALHELEAEEG